MNQTDGNGKSISTDFGGCYRDIKVKKPLLYFYI